MSVPWDDRASFDEAQATLEKADVKRGVHRTSTACAFQLDVALTDAQAHHGTRKRKSRCDGQLPVCGPCSRSRKLGPADCQYTESRDRAANSRAYIASLEAKVSALEGQVSNAPSPPSQPRLPPVSSFAPPPMPTAWPTPSSFGPEPTFALPATSVPLFSPSSLSYIPPVLDPTYADTMQRGSSAPSNGHPAGSVPMPSVNGMASGARSPSTHSSDSVNRQEAARLLLGVAGAGSGQADEPTHEFAHLATDARGNRRYVGGSSMALLVEAIGNQPTMPGEVKLDLPFFVPIRGDLPMSRRRMLGALVAGESEAALPSNAICKRILAAYFTHFHPLTPVLDRTAFLKRFDEVMEPRNLISLAARVKAPPVPNRSPSRPGSSAAITDNRQVAFVALCYAALACGTTVMSEAELPHAAHLGASWHERASILHFSSSREASIELVQTLVLKAVYASGVGGDVAGAWALIGSALRTAQDLGLHRSTATLGLSPLETQRRRIVFCIDRELSFALGRSMGIDQADIDVELPFEFDDDELRTVDSVDKAVRGPDPTIMSGFIAAIGFHCHARRTKRAIRQLDKCDDTSAPHNADAIKSILSPVALSMDAMVDQLPSVIRNASSLEAPRAIWAQSIWLLVLHCSSIYNLFRPVAQNAKDKEAPLVRYAYERCVAAGLVMSSLGQVVRDSIPPSHDLAFASQQTLLAGVMLCRAGNVAGARNCVASLRLLEDRWPGAGRCVDIVQRAIEQLRRKRTAAEAALLPTDEEERLPEEIARITPAARIWDRMIRCEPVSGEANVEADAFAAMLAHIVAPSGAPSRAVSPIFGSDDQLLSWANTDWQLADWTDATPWGALDGGTGMLY